VTGGTVAVNLRRRAALWHAVGAEAVSGETLMAYWVIGGEYTDTGFKTLAPGTKEQRLGPFATSREAREVWASHAFATVDKAHARYRIYVEKDGKMRQMKVSRSSRSSRSRDVGTR
jgi:hypothetical protein